MTRHCEAPSLSGGISTQAPSVFEQKFRQPVESLLGLVLVIRLQPVKVPGHHRVAVAEHLDLHLHVIGRPQVDRKSHHIGFDERRDKRRQIWAGQRPRHLVTDVASWGVRLLR